MTAQLIAIRLPSISSGMTQGEIGDWLVETGGAVEKGEPVATIEIDKANMELEATVDGLLCRQVVAEGTEVPVGTLIGVIATGPIPSEQEIDRFVAENP